jgi:hypothetical protein
MSGNTGVNSPKPGLASSIESGIVTSDYGSEGTQSDGMFSNNVILNRFLLSYELCFAVMLR